MVISRVGITGAMALTVLAGVTRAPVVAAQDITGNEEHSQSTRLEELVVTAQKRVESAQTIPVAVTVLTKQSMDVNDVVDVSDLNGLAPNLTVRPATGGTNLPAFSMRGITSYGVVAGSDKEISIYLDGVYIGSPRGSIFTLPDIEQLEVLRGPQGTLFGRNATGGAISIRTRDPAGTLQFRQKVRIGNRSEQATETTIDFPAVGPFSAYVTYAQESRDGDIKNLGAGTRWDRTAFGYGTATSPKTLGAVDTDSVFLSTYLDLDDVTVSYKFDYSTDKGTPRGNAILTDFYPQALGPLQSSFEALVAANSALAKSSKTRPDAVNNAFSIKRDQKVQGHNLYLEWSVNDELTLKNTLAYRKTEVFQPADISGTSGWTLGSDPGLFSLSILLPPGVTAAPGDPFCYVCSQANSEGDQWSNEMQFDYEGEYATVITGLLYYESKDESGSPRNSINTFAPGVGTTGVFPGYVIPRASEGVSFNKAKSYAIYSQGEFHITDTVDLLAGLRYTKDKKSGSFWTGLPEDPPLVTATVDNPDGGYWKRSFNYSDGNVDYLIGVNYQVSDFIMVYGKYSTAYVSGGSVAGFDFDKEDVKSWELGSKADFFDSTLRANVAVFDATYDNLQTAQSGVNIAGAEGIGVLIVPGGKLKAQGFEAELSALPIDGLILTASVGYVNPRYTEVNPTVFDSVGGSTFPNSSFEQTLTPDWNGNLGVHYDTNPIFDTAYVSFGLTGIWHDKIRLEPNPGRAAATPFGQAEYTPETWIVNARLSLKDISLGSGWTGEVALWGQNLTDDGSVQFATNFGAFPSGTFQEARSYGIDFVVKYK